MAGFSVSSNAMQIARYFRGLPRDVQDGIVVSLDRELQVVQGRVIQGSEIKHRGNRGLFGRLTSFARGAGLMGLDGAVGFRKTRGFPYEYSQEFGAKAKAGGAMSIPLTTQARNVGSPRLFPAELNLIKVGGRVFLFKVGARGTIVGKPQYILVKSIRPRLHFFRTMVRNLSSISSAIVNGAKKGMNYA